MNRRDLFRLAGATAFIGAGLGSYAFAIEPRFRLEVTRYRLTPPRWPANAKPLRIVALADLHACDPWMPLSRIEEIVDVTNGLKPDLIVLLGDYVAGMRRFRTAVVPPKEWGRVFRDLKAPLGVHSVLGNHDWWDDEPGSRRGLLDNDIPVMENDAVLLRPENGSAFWLAGLGDQIARIEGPGQFRGVDDLPGTMEKITDDDRPVIMLAHEPDIFVKMPERVSLTLSGHTHGGQVNLPFVGRSVVPSAYGSRYAYGHIVEDGRNLIVSGGLGCSVLPVRFGVPPEIVLIELGGVEEAPAA
jgi:uncharacterized protein